MTGGQKTALIAVAGLLALSLTRRAVAGGNMLFYPGGIKGFSFDGLTPVFKLGLIVQNTSNNTYNVNSIAASLFNNGTLVGNVSAFGLQAIPPNSQMVLVINARLGALSIVNDLINAFQTKNFQFDVELKGTANVDGWQVPINLDYKIGV